MAIINGAYEAIRILVNMAEDGASVEELKRQQNFIKELLADSEHEGAAIHVLIPIKQKEYPDDQIE